MADTRDLALRLDQTESELAIQRLAHEYCHGADKRDLIRFVGVWDDEAVWVTGPDRQFRGIDEIRAAVVDQWGSFRRMQHWTSNLVIELDGDRATGECDVYAVAQLPDGAWLRSGGSYRDRYVRRAGQWRIARREVASHFNMDPLPPGFGPPDREPSG